MFLVAERAIHEGSLEAYVLPALPPDVASRIENGRRTFASDLLGLDV
jgi:hypothetical protein